MAGIIRLHIELVFYGSSLADVSEDNFILRVFLLSTSIADRSDRKMTNTRSFIHFLNKKSGLSNIRKYPRLLQEVGDIAVTVTQKF
ncbi:hypothetical protein C7B77_08210 [Chamaesiphon polymorphus CCALA 037]|uniref:Uncharacterized protein n=1 Tax=Chamaesiphon polymorphus CCALA 037 TaxID=2107692 RepID=A0A2T1GIE0_9CYAN|nr:hypothetical protein C7B77_08210 [Chamaesiphon polymorphus CCALA 037]